MKNSGRLELSRASTVPGHYSSIVPKNIKIRKCAVYIGSMYLNSVQLLYTHILHSEENEVGLDSKQVCIILVCHLVSIV